MMTQFAKMKTSGVNGSATVCWMYTTFFTVLVTLLSVLKDKGKSVILDVIASLLSIDLKRCWLHLDKARLAAYPCFKS